MKDGEISECYNLPFTLTEEQLEEVGTSKEARDLSSWNSIMRSDYEHNKEIIIECAPLWGG